jgi:hypothetical protein
VAGIEKAPARGRGELQDGAVPMFWLFRCGRRRLLLCLGPNEAAQATMTSYWPGPAAHAGHRIASRRPGFIKCGDEVARHLAPCIETLCLLPDYVGCLLYRPDSLDKDLQSKAT